MMAILLTKQNWLGKISTYWQFAGPVCENFCGSHTPETMPNDINA